MLRLVLRRLVTGIIVLWAVSVIIFVATQALPGDTAQAILGKQATPARLAALRAELGVNQPMVVQYLDWLKGVFTFDLGNSLVSGLPLSEVLPPRISNSLVLMLIAASVATPLSILIGTLAAYRRDKGPDHATQGASLIIASLPEFVIGILLVLIFATGVFHWLPAVFVAKQPGPIWVDPSQLVLPALTLALVVMPYIVRMTRATMIEVLEAEYVQQARLKGLSERKILFKHALPNAVGPIAQVVALQLAWLAGGAVVVEYLFRFPGVGLALVDAVNNRDLPVVQGLSLLIAAVYIVVNLVADLIALAANPRVRTSK